MGLLNETLLDGPGLRAAGLGTCCKDLAKGDYNYEVLCWDHVRSFEGFLDIVEDPSDITGNAEGNGDSYRRHNATNSSPIEL